MQPVEKKVTAEMMEEETETVDVVKDKPASDPIQILVEEEQVNQILIDSNKMTAESPVVVVEEISVAVEDPEESTNKGNDESGEKEPREMDLKECVEEADVEGFDEEKSKKKETVEKVGEKTKVEKYVETAKKEDGKISDVSVSTDEAGEKHGNEKYVEAVSADVKIQTTEVHVPEVESNPVAFEGNESASEVEVKAEENSKTKEVGVEPQVKLEEKTVETKCPEEVVLISQVLVSEPKNESGEVAISSPVDYIEKINAEAKHIVEEQSQGGEENKSKEKDVINELVKEDEIIKDDNLKQTDVESKEREFSGKRQEEMITVKAAEGLQTEPDVKESSKAQQESEITENEVAMKPKRSNNIISKVKQSLVKAKKAIIGKSPS